MINPWDAGRATAARREIGPHYLDPSLLDSVTQLLAPFIMEKGKTFVLRSIEKVQVMDFDFPDTLWGHATLLPAGDGGAKGILGTVRVFDQSGKPYVELSGVAFTLLDRADAADHKAAVNLVIASNFTAEPLEDSLDFWGDHFGVRLRTEFAPYNQIFQQLLDTGSAFRRNSDGANVILLGLEEWTTGEQRAPMAIGTERAEQCFGTVPMRPAERSRNRSPESVRDGLRLQGNLRRSMLSEARHPPARRGYGGGYRSQYRALFLVCDEPLQESDDLRLRAGSGGL